MFNEKSSSNNFLAEVTKSEKGAAILKRKARNPDPFTLMTPEELLSHIQNHYEPGDWKKVKKNTALWRAITCKGLIHEAWDITSDENTVRPDGYFDQMTPKELLTHVSRHYEPGDWKEMTQDRYLLRALEERGLREQVQIKMSSGRPKRQAGYFQNMTYEDYVKELQKQDLIGQPISTIQTKDGSLERAIRESTFLPQLIQEGKITRGRKHQKNIRGPSPHSYGRINPGAHRYHCSPLAKYAEPAKLPPKEVWPNNSGYSP